ncbi:MAG: proline iminopeptidase [Paraglaciecola psychrophila]|jgi:proline iminopeptidase
MMSLYPLIKPYAEHRLSVASPHCLYIEESGNAEGIPVLFVHGGPGSGCDARARSFFDPLRYRIIAFDQRGAGQSTPHAELQGNDSGALVEDMEQIREYLGIEQWLLFGGSWGTTLSLIYAQAHPQRVLALIMRGVFLCRQQDLHWLYQQGASRIFPDYWEDFLRPVAVAERGDLLAAYYRLLTGSNELTRMAAARAWSLWEGRCSTLRPDSDVLAHFNTPHTALAMARIEAHYFVNKGFITENQILQQMDTLAAIPGIIVHGRYDMVCRLDNAQALHNAWPGSELHIVSAAGHSSSEPGITDALIRATRDMADRLEGVKPPVGAGP